MIGEGSNFLWPLVLTQRGPNNVFQNFCPMAKTVFFGQRGAMAQSSLNMPLCVKFCRKTRVTKIKSRTSIRRGVIEK